MAATNESRGGALDPVHGKIVNQHDFLVLGGVKIPDNTLFSTDATGYAVQAADVAGQNGRAVLYALEEADNTNGADGAISVRAMIRGTARLEKGALVQADVGFVAHVFDNQTLATSSTQNRPIGIILAVGGNRATVQIG